MSINTPEPRPNISVDFDPDEIQIIVQSLRRRVQAKDLPIDGGRSKGKLLKLAAKLADAIRHAR